MDVDHPLREALEERRSQKLHVAGADHQLDALALEPVGHRAVARVAVRRALELEGRRRDVLASARTSARAPATFDATATTGSPASRSACRFVPSPDTSTPITP